MKRNRPPLRLQPNIVIRILGWLLKPVVAEAHARGAIIDGGYIAHARKIAAGGNRPGAHMLRMFPELQQQFGAAVSVAVSDTGEIITGATGD